MIDYDYKPKSIFFSLWLMDLRSELEQLQVEIGTGPTPALLDKRKRIEKSIRATIRSAIEWDNKEKKYRKKFTMPNKDVLYNCSGAAYMKGCSNVTIARAIDEGLLEAEPIHGKDGEHTSWAIRESQLKNWSPRPKGRPASK